MKKQFSLLSLTVGILLLFGCQKVDQITNPEIKHKLYLFTRTSWVQNMYDQVNTTKTYTFEEDGTGQLIIENDRDILVEDFNWETSNNHTSVHILNSSNYYDTYNNVTVSEYKLVWYHASHSTNIADEQEVLTPY